MTASAQATRVGLEGIEAGALRLRGARHRAVLEVAGVGLALQDAPEREALVAGFAALLNGLTFPVQLVVRVLPVDVERYAAELEERARRVLPEPLAALARDHAAYVRRLARARTLLERRFYVVVPAEDAPPAARRLWPLGRPPDDAVDGAAARRLLAARCDEVARQLGRCGVAARRLESPELARLLHGCWCPELARVQRVRRALEEYTALVVRAAPEDAPCAS